MSDGSAPVRGPRSSPADDAGQDRDGSAPSPALIMAGMVVLALVLRFLRLGEWSFEATEMFTLRDSVRPQWHNPRPLGYLLNYYLVRPFHPLDEFGLRLMPALAGVLALPVFYAVARRLVGTRAALLGTLLVTLSALHVFYSQFARYWSLVFLFCSAYPYALYLGLRDRSWRWIGIGVAALILAVLSHPVSIVAIGGPLLWMMWTYLRPGYLRQAWAFRSVRWSAAVAAVLAGVLAVRLVPMLQNWVVMHDTHPEMGQFLLPPKRPLGVRQLVLLMGYLESLTLPLVLAAAAGVYVLWRERERPVAILIASVAVFHLLFIALISTRAPVSLFYLLPAAPAFYLAAGVFLDRIFQVEWGLRPRWLLPATITIALLVPGLPTLVSQYLNGRRFDFRGTAQWLRPRLAPGDVVASDQPMVMAHYLPEFPVGKLRQDPAPLGRTVRSLAPGRTLWVVAPAPAHAFRTNLEGSGLARWLYDNCQVSSTVGQGRIDFRQQYLEVFRCPPAPPPAGGS
jgi:4-amino-4-deoxy-L-arabinose transferase-like glycosyltransferase